MKSEHEAGSGSHAIARPGAGPGELRLFTHDHRRLAWMYAIAIGLALVAGTVLAIGLGLQPLAGRGQGLDAEGYRRLYSMHGLVMVFLVALPALPAIVGNWLLPERLGVDEMAWPRMNLVAFQLFLLGCASFLIAFLATPLDTGWDFELPYALQSRSGVAWGLLGIVFVAGSYATAGANAVATVIASRAGGRSWSELPLFAWALGFAGLVQALVTPVLLVALALFFAQRSGASDVFARGAAEVGFERWFWLWGHPALASMVLAAIAVVSEVVERSRAPAARGASFAAVTSLAAIAILAFAGFGVHLLGRGASPAADAAASALALVSGVPLCVLVVDWASVLACGEARASAALGFAATAIVSLVLGAMAAAFLAVLPTGAYLANTSFATGALHFLVVGGTLGALLAGVHHLWPRWFGVPVREGWARLAAFLFFAGVLLAFVPACVRGYLGEPRRAAELAIADPRLELCAVAGATLLVAALALAAWNLLATLLDSRVALARREGA